MRHDWRWLQAFYVIVDVEIFDFATGFNVYSFVRRSCLLIAVSRSGQPRSWGVSKSAIF